MFRACRGGTPKKRLLAEGNGSLAAEFPQKKFCLSVRAAPPTGVRQWLLPRGLTCHHRHGYAA